MGHPPHLWQALAGNRARTRSKAHSSRRTTRPLSRSKPRSATRKRRLRDGAWLARRARPYRRTRPSPPSGASKRTAGTQIGFVYRKVTRSEAGPTQIFTPGRVANEQLADQATRDERA